jgi:uncharacterized protein YjbI with pentapeptide repeats
MDDAIIDGGAISDTSVDRTSLHGAEVRGVSLSRVRFKNSDCGVYNAADSVRELYPPALWQSCVLDGVSWDGCNFSGAEFPDCRASAVTITDSNFNDATLFMEGA